MDTILERVLRGEKTSHTPFWFMRQAGRYLPEYRELRAKTKSFLTMCYSPELAAEVTMQPIRRFDMSAAIIFSDILVIPHAMGVKVEFVQGEGPLLSKTQEEPSIQALKTDVTTHLKPVAEALTLVRSQLDKDKSLIGFCGAPWTVACYMIEGKNNGDWEEARTFALTKPGLFEQLIDKLVVASSEYLGMQIEAGANILQIFDSWAGVLSESEYRKWVIAPTQKLVSQVKKKYPHIPIIGFPRSSGALYEEYANNTNVDGISIDFSTPIAWAAKTITKTIQGNLDPMILANDKNKAVDETKRILDGMRGKKFIFNLGHGIVPHTPLENVSAVCETIRAYR